MMKRVVYSFILLLVAGTLGMSCVSKKKYQEMETLKDKVQRLLEDKRKDYNNVRAERDSLKGALGDCDEAKAALQADTARLGKRYREVSGELAGLNVNCARMKENYTKLKSQSSAKIRDLIDELEELQEDLGQREKRLKEVERKLAFRDSVMNSLEEKITGALLNFKGKDLSVEVKNGKVYITLSNKLLFASGSWSINENGKKALQDLAPVLQEQKDISIMVEGHTDDVPVSNLGQIKDNWDLSVMRSTEVVRILIEAGVDPLHVVPAGRSEFLPVVDEKTKEARAINRRTEIILSPDLEELFNLINEK